MGQQWTAAGAGALGTADLGMAQALLEEIAINPTIKSHQNLHRTGETDSWRAQTKLCTGTQEKGAVTPPHKRVTQTCL